MAFSTAGSGVLRAEINITPMIDILLVLMIVFMVAVTMSGEKGLQTEIPQPANSTQSSPAPTTVVIQLNWMGENQAPSVKINEESVKICMTGCSIFLSNGPSGLRSSRATTMWPSSMWRTRFLLRGSREWREWGC